MATKAMAWIPERAQSMIRQHTFAGGKMIVLDDEVVRPSWKV